MFTIFNRFTVVIKGTNKSINLTGYRTREAAEQAAQDYKRVFHVECEVIDKAAARKG